MTNVINDEIQYIESTNDKEDKIKDSIQEVCRLGFNPTT